MNKYQIDLIESNDFSALKEKYPELGKGELSVIASARGRIAFIEDRRAEKVAESEGIAVFNIPVLLFALKENGMISNLEVARIVEELKNKDGYLLKKEIEEELLK
ncbi:hypothetical protein [Archaeoglobus veneficus]|uniref:DUF3368 domain-containing protein n=1 Tax=Archaeoglobus veneficus (strain DSM 11195 / SNP6) TaxID=693661 RepID=F2KSL0_ARCVS|nr:hypothetical protein [Archaeoglobus veneficus]AEA48080.1 hypothetical protein Arcve_2091 [Archaeoglobus veneficus SNP6]